MREIAALKQAMLLAAREHLGTLPSQRKAQLIAGAAATLLAEWLITTGADKLRIESVIADAAREATNEY